jgi:Fe-S-cluster containining protein
VKKPVHPALTKPTTIRNYTETGKFPDTRFGASKDSFPEPPQNPAPVKPALLPKFGSSTSITKKVNLKLKLQVIHERIPPIPKDQQPDCNSCKTKACCTVFVVPITEMEYESGLYGDSAVKITPEISAGLQHRWMIPTMLTAPITSNKEYYLEGKVGEPCPFLANDGGCSIYDIRPTTCRTYTCVGDSRITESMKNGSQPINEAALAQGRLFAILRK